MVRSHIPGLPRIGAERELKVATEGYWAGKVPEQDLRRTGEELRSRNWQMTAAAGIDLGACGDFSFYDHVLDTICMLGAIPKRYGQSDGQISLETYFAMARGRQEAEMDVTAMEMTKWFDTNYHYIVPELDAGSQFSFSSDKVVAEFREASKQGFSTVPVILGPISFLLLSKHGDQEAADFKPLQLLERVLPVYRQVLQELGTAGAEWVQLDEPVLVQNRDADDLQAVRSTYKELAAVSTRPQMLIKTYFDHVGESYPVLKELPVEGIGLDFAGGPFNEELVLQDGGLAGKTLFAGVVNGRNIWINDLGSSMDLLKRLREHCAELIVTTSCSLLHVPVDLAAETDLDPEIREWLAFARQKVDEVAALTRGLNEGDEAIAGLLQANQAALKARRDSSRAVDPEVRSRLQSLSPAEYRRETDYSKRRVEQRRLLDLPSFPTTTIGSYPQTEEIRQARARLRKKEITQDEYKEGIKQEIERVVRFQEKAGLDVLVHGEPERNDMVQYFAEQLRGYAFTQNGWVQSYGTRYVRPPIIYGDIHRPQPMTVEWTRFAQSLTDKPLKGMLTGPVTMLMWSFVRDDQPRSETCRQLALAIRDEVQDLEEAGFRVIQVDEPAMREGLPLRRDRWQEYLQWAVDCFRLTTSGVEDATQIQTHMCYADFGDIIDAIEQMDADVALIEASRSNMELLEDFRHSGYQREIGPGVYDIHSPRVPSVEEMAQKLRLALNLLRPEQVWVNPDCGLKTRTWRETEVSLKNMVAAAGQLRAEAEDSGAERQA